MEKKNIPVFFAVDDNYVDFLRITISSIIDNAADETYSYSFNILHSGLSSESKKKLKKLSSRRFKIAFHNVEGNLTQMFNRFKLRDYYSMTTYYRLIIPDTFFLLDKALYLDCDIVVLDDLKNLYEYDLGENLVGAVPDASVPLIDEFGVYTRNALHIEPERYFNAGVLSMNLKKMRSYHFLNRITELTKTTVFRVAQDQDLLNVTCKDRVLFLPDCWNVMPVAGHKTEISLIHYNLIYKPWKHRDVMYQEHFWHYAKKLNLDEKFKQGLNEMTEGNFEHEILGMENLKKLCLYEAEQPEHYSGVFTMDENGVDYSLSAERSEIYEKIKLLEKERKFDVDAENDPPYTPLRPGDVDYKHKKFKTKVRAKAVNDYAFRYFKSLVKKGEIVIDGVEGEENLKNLRQGAIVTANHFNPFDSIPLHLAVQKYHYKKTLFKVIKEGNYSYPGLYGTFMRNCNTLPLANNYEVFKEMMSGLTYWLKKGYLVLVYPEQALWWNYKKPRPTKTGAFRFAAKNLVPVLPTFITMRKTEKLNAEGDAILAYTLHILPPIFPKEELSLKENIAYLQELHDKAWKELYEKTYGVPLTYDS